VAAPVGVDGELPAGAEKTIVTSHIFAQLGNIRNLIILLILKVFTKKIFAVVVPLKTAGCENKRREQSQRKNKKLD
jgi:hypothetical protein